MTFCAQVADIFVVFRSTAYQRYYVIRHRGFCDVALSGAVPAERFGLEPT